MGMDAQEFERVSRALLRTHPGDERCRMLQSAGVRTAGRCYGFAGGEDLVVTLPAPRVAELIATGRGRPCAPRRGRPMREWVRLRPDGADSATAYLLEARAFVVGRAESRPHKGKGSL